MIASLPFRTRPARQILASVLLFPLLLAGCDSEQDGQKAADDKAAFAARDRGATAPPARPGSPARPGMSGTDPGSEITLSLALADSLQPLAPAVEKACEQTGGCRLVWRHPLQLLREMRLAARAEPGGEGPGASGTAQMRPVPAFDAVFLDHRMWRDLALLPLFPEASGQEGSSTGSLAPLSEPLAVSPLVLATGSEKRDRLLSLAGLAPSDPPVTEDGEDPGDSSGTSPDRNEDSADGSLALRMLPGFARAGEITHIQGLPGRDAAASEAFLAMLAALPGDRQVPTLRHLANLVTRENLASWYAAQSERGDGGPELRRLYLEQAGRKDPAAFLSSAASWQALNQDLTAQGLDPLVLLPLKPGAGRLEMRLQSLLSGTKGENAGDVDREEQAVSARLAEFQAALASILRQDLPDHADVTGSDALASLPGGWLRPDAPVDAAPMPEPDLLRLALNLYRNDLRKPSLLALCMEDGPAHSEHPLAAVFREELSRFFDPLEMRRQFFFPGARDQLLVLSWQGKDDEAALLTGPDEIATMATRPESPPSAADPGTGPADDKAGDTAYQCLQDAARMVTGLQTRDPAEAGLLLVMQGGDISGLGSLDRYYRLTGLTLPVHILATGDDSSTVQKNLARMTGGMALALPADAEDDGALSPARLEQQRHDQVEKLLFRLLGWF